MASLSNPLALTLALAAAGSPNVPEDIQTFLSPGSLAGLLQQNSSRLPATAPSENAQSADSFQTSQWFNFANYNACINFSWRRC